MGEVSGRVKALECSSIGDMESKVLSTSSVMMEILLLTGLPAGSTGATLAYFLWKDLTLSKILALTEM